jgi:hypothetical protein
MISQTSRKVIVASGITTVAIGIGVLIFALPSRPMASVVQPLQPPTATPQIPAAAPTVVAPIADAPVALSDAPAADTPSDEAYVKGPLAGAPPAGQPAVTGYRPLAKAPTNAVTTDGIASR